MTLEQHESFESNKELAKEPTSEPGDIKESLFKRIKRLIYALLGFIFTGLAIVGVMLPIMPTTPFLLLAAGCFSRSSKRFDYWFKNTKLYKKHLSDFVTHRSMTIATKAKICILASVMLVIAFIFSPVIYARIFIVAVIVFLYYYFIFRIKTIKPGGVAVNLSQDTKINEVE